MANFIQGLPSLTDGLKKTHPDAANMIRATGGVMRRVASALPASAMTGPDGRIDFENERSIYGKIDSRRLRCR